MDADVAKQAIPFKGPPMLVGSRTGFALAQMPPIAFWLGDEHGLLPAGVDGKALSLKVANDANAVIDELTIDGGRQMGTPARWKAFRPRLRRWMAIREKTGRRHGLRVDAGHPPGGRVGVADIVTATLWSTVGERFPAIGERLDDEAPAVAGPTGRRMSEPALANLAKASQEQFGDSDCDGQIEKSLRRVADAKQAGHRRARANTRARRVDMIYIIL